MEESRSMLVAEGGFSNLPSLENSDAGCGVMVATREDDGSLKVVGDIDLLPEVMEDILTPDEIDQLVAGWGELARTGCFYFKS